jgi:NADH dehydrogenase FAD-containing subunit
MASPNTAVRNQRVVIIRAGSGGLSAAKRLAKSPCRITLIDRHNLPLVSTFALSASCTNP